MICQEIGSEFWDIPLSQYNNNIFNDACFFNSGRSALRAIIQDIKNSNPQAKKILMPDYCCESMIAPFIIEEIDVVFYHIDFNQNGLYANFDNVGCKADIVFLMDYFGFSTVEYPDSILNGKILIRDITHSIFSKTYDDSDYYFGSLRKWAGFFTGGFAVKSKGKILCELEKDDEYIQLRQQAMTLKKQYMNGQLNNKAFLSIYAKAEQCLDDCKICDSSFSDKENSHFLDVNYIKKKRRKNAKYLIDNLGSFAIYKNLDARDCPLFVPLLIENRDSLRNYLIQHNVYCPVHWPKPKYVINNSELYEKEISIICDQRYSLDDMKKMVELILLWRKFNA